MIVVDCGCFPHGGVDSIGYLVERFEPDVVYGFDPWPALKEGVEMIGETRVVRSRRAVWTHEGVMRYTHADAGATMLAENRRGRWGKHTTSHVDCVDLAAFLVGIRGHTVVVKLDVEGAEYAVLEHLADLGLDDDIELLLVEWHDQHLPPEYAQRRAALEGRLSCPVEEWTL